MVAPIHAISNNSLGRERRGIQHREGNRILKIINLLNGKDRYDNGTQRGG